MAAHKAHHETQSSNNVQMGPYRLFPLRGPGSGSLPTLGIAPYAHASNKHGLDLSTRLKNVSLNSLYRISKVAIGPDKSHSTGRNGV